MSTFTQLVGSSLSGQELARYIDHTLLKPEGTEAQIIQLCEEAQRYHFIAVCVNPVWVKRCATLLSGSDTRIAAVAGFQHHGRFALAAEVHAIGQLHRDRPGLSPGCVIRIAIQCWRRGDFRGDQHIRGRLVLAGRTAEH